MLDELVIADSSSDFSRGVDRALTEEQFLTDIVKDGGRANFARLFDEVGFGAAYERTWVPKASSPSTRSDEDVIYAFAVCLATTEGATSYARSGATDTVPDGRLESLTADDGRLTVVNHGSAATALLRSDRLVITFTAWSDDGPVDDALLREMAEKQAQYLRGL